MPKASNPLLTQRTYTMRLSGDTENLWRTHEAVNKGAQAFGDILLTFRGGISPSIIEHLQKAGKSGKHERLAQLRTILALSWLSVESARGAPSRYVIPHHLDPQSGRYSAWQTPEALKSILQNFGMPEPEVMGWLADCRVSLEARIRDDAVWVNRRAAFQDLQRKCAGAITDDDLWDLLSRFFKSQQAYFSPTPKDTDAPKKVPMTLMHSARQWLSDRFGRGEGANFQKLSVAYKAIASFARANVEAGQLSGTEFSSKLAEALSHLQPSPADMAGVLRLISATGHKSGTRRILHRLGEQDRVEQTEITQLADQATLDEKKADSKIGQKGRRPYSDFVLRELEAASGIPYYTKKDTSRMGPYCVFLDHGARRVVTLHAKIKAADSLRRELVAEIAKSQSLPPEAKRWLDEYCRLRTEISGSINRPHCIRQRALDGLESVISAWAQPSCRSDEDRRTAAQKARALAGGEKWGDGHLFQSLAASQAKTVWLIDKKPSPDILRAYSSGSMAADKLLRNRLQCYRHPDPFFHPIFCDFGPSRLPIRMAAHEARKKRERVGESIRTFKNRIQGLERGLAQAKSPDKIMESECDLAEYKQKLQRAEEYLAFLHDPRALTIGLWTSSEIEETSFRWHSKRLFRDLGLDQYSPMDAKAPVSVTRADRLGRAAAGAGPRDTVDLLSVWDTPSWNGRLQASRAQLARIGELIEGSARKEKLSRYRKALSWTMSFALPLCSQGPWLEYKRTNQDIVSDFFASSRNRGGQGRIVLSRLPGLRVLSVVLAQKCAAACAVWEAVTEKDVLEACAAAHLPPPEEHDLYCHVYRGQTATIFRRIGPAILVQDGKGRGKRDSPAKVSHPAPWARLERTFFVKLQGEGTSRKPSDAEFASVRQLENELGMCGSRQEKCQVHELQQKATRLLMYSLKRHAQHARIAYGFHQLPHSFLEKSRETSAQMVREKATLQALLEWRRCAESRRYPDKWALAAWENNISPLLEKPAKRGGTDGRDGLNDPTGLQLRSVAKKLTPSNMSKIHILWATRWRQDDEKCRARLRWLSKWLLPRAEHKEDPSIRGVGGLGTDRITTLELFFRCQQSFAMRPEPQDPQKGFPQKKVAVRTVRTLQELRENRRKQLVSRIVEAALGIGRTTSRVHNHEKGYISKRPRAQKDAPCHAVVIQSLDLSLPHLSQGSGLSATNFREDLKKACELHGLFFRELYAPYVDRQDFMTGKAGLRIREVHVKEFITENTWAWRIWRSAARKDIFSQEISNWERYLCGLLDRCWDSDSRIWSEHGKCWTIHESGVVSNELYCDSQRDFQSPLPLAVPHSTGPIFISSSLSNRKVAADINAAASLGIAALMDPDWPPRWWYCPTDCRTGLLLSEQMKGSAALVREPIGRKSDLRKAGYATSPKKAKAVMNLWRTITAAPLSEGTWLTYDEFWSGVKDTILELLAEKREATPDTLVPEP